MKNTMVKIMLMPFLIMSLISLAFGCSNGQVKSSTEIDYLYALKGLTVGTSLYHPEVGRPPPPGMKFPSAFYEPSSINTIPPVITETITLQPGYYGVGKSIAVFEGSVIDLLVQGDVDIYWALDKTGCVNFKVSGLDATINPNPGLSLQQGMYYENVTTLIATEGSQTTVHSTAMRVIALYGGNFGLSFNNNSTQGVTITYSLWNADQENGYREYYEQIDGVYESGKYSADEIVKMQYEMRVALERQW
jgi:hypothetical protein